MNAFCKKEMKLTVFSEKCYECFLKHADECIQPVAQQQYFFTLQLILNPLAPQVAVLIEAAQDNQ